ncbi:MAG: aminoacyl-tRNA hydrolase [Rickettsiales bacterium]|jgi:PTH1 family peptidyl-tRNA hydrolase|nr:aminoacyl-tRNA hydrolase [Rickettsiales bacterium]
MEKKASLIVGLGNPEPEYAGTRHNAGFMAVNAMAGAGAVWKKEKNYLAAKIGRLIFVKPATFMNLSGAAVLAAMTKHKIPLGNVAVIHDDIDLKLGDARTKVGGGNAGHNGLKSISAAVGNDYRRVRIGVGRPESKDYDIADWVLGKFTKSELAEIENVISDKIPNLCPECAQ